MKISLSILLVLLTFTNYFTDRLFPDLHVSSKSGRYRVDATSPDNENDGYHPFQDDFTYRFIDTKTGDTIWTRKQPESGEGSPASIMISNKGVTIIYTGYDDMIVISSIGKVIRKIDFLKDALTSVENRKYVHETTAGPMWAGLSISYFVEHATQNYFVIRPWWGRRVIINVEYGEIQKANDAIISACIQSEKEFVMESLKSEATNDDEQFEKSLAIYLAGVLKLKKAVPYLRDAEKSTFIGSSTSGGLSWDEKFNDEVDPHSYRTYSIRQIAQLSLRRLGEKPRSLPCHSFEITRDGKSHPFTTDLKNERHENVRRLKVGMSAKEILTLIGHPDFVSYDKWSYDMDSEPPFSLTIRMDARKSTAIKREKPIWLDRLDRDESLAN